MAVRFDATADRLVRTTNVVNYNSVYSWAGWFRITDVSGNRTLFAVGVDSFFANYDQYRCAFGTFGCKNNVGETTSAGGALTSTTWMHLAGVRESATSQKGYVDGTLVATNTSNVGTGRTAVSRMELGGFTTSDIDPYDGRIFGFKVWDAALTLAEIAAERWSLLPVRTTNLNTFSPLWPGSGERNRNYGANADWTVGGTLTDEDGPPVFWSPRSYQGYAIVSGGTTYTDTGSAASALSGSGADVATLSDAATAVSVLTGSGADAATFGDAATAVSALTGSGADAATFADSASAASVFTGSGADAATFADAATALSALTGSGADAAVLSDAATAVMGTVGSGTDANVYDDAATAASVLTGSGAEVAVLSDSGAGLAALFGAGSDAAILVDSGTGVLTAIGSGTDTTPAAAILGACALLSQQAKPLAALAQTVKPRATITPALRTAVLSQQVKPLAILTQQSKPSAAVTQRAC